MHAGGFFSRIPPPLPRTDVTGHAQLVCDLRQVIQGNAVCLGYLADGGKTVTVDRDAHLHSSRHQPRRHGSAKSSTRPVFDANTAKQLGIVLTYPEPSLYAGRR